MFISALYELTTMLIDFAQVMRYNDVLQKIRAVFKECMQAVRDGDKSLKPTFISDDNPNKDINVAFFNFPYLKRLRELTTAEIGKLVLVTGVVTRTSEVDLNFYKELLSAWKACV
ncbi:hypothetical protein Dsin_028667 [Dipteronia sinensis]|uniref:Uncharacterized protein n=1 Tax=Dipteronia sinensis TaxID=43782 RepID=A0AAD9ZSH5_9ROSI|nr:hypothetical protein Dsin_028667 [Dipteronia sinensis]